MLNDPNNVSINARHTRRTRRMNDTTSTYASLHHKECENLKHAQNTQNRPPCPFPSRSVREHTQSCNNTVPFFFSAHEAHTPRRPHTKYAGNKLRDAQCIISYTFAGDARQPKRTPCRFPTCTVENRAARKIKHDMQELHQHKSPLGGGARKHTINTALIPFLAL